MESGHFHVLLESEVFNGTRSWRDKRRSGAGKGVLLGSPGLKREPYVGNRRKDTRNCREIGDNRIGRRGSYKDNPSRDEFKPPDKERDWQFPEG